MATATKATATKATATIATKLKRLRLPSKQAHFMSGSDHDRPFGQWWTYPAGAQITLLGGTLRIHVTRRHGGGWDAIVQHHCEGTIFLADNVNTRKIAIDSVHEWLEKQVKLLYACMQCK